jgi:adenylylsulfate kinase-like enzyme
MGSATISEQKQGLEVLEKESSAELLLDPRWQLVERIRSIGYTQLLVQQQVIVLVAAISPYRAARACVRGEIGNFLEVYVNAPLETCIQRDPKQFYARATRRVISLHRDRRPV